ncbi:MAG: hypothetical protein IKY90_00800 [Oscillospiraceae bacterium]|nr:hypothetical protein [Oscillospiraceae bacterium]
MKKAIVFFITVILLFALTVLESEGITSALLYQNKSEKLISALEKENFTYASNFLSFYGKSDIKAARSKWAQDMQDCGIEFKEIHCDKLWGDDGIAQANASALLENGEEIYFRIIVQGKGLSISGVSDNNGVNEDYSRLMTTYNPG